MREVFRAGALPYDDGSGYKVNIVIEGPSEYFDYPRIILNPESEFCDFSVSEWEAVRNRIDRLVAAFKTIHNQEPDQ